MANFIETQNTLTSKINLFEQKIKHLSYLLEQSRNRQIQLEIELNELDVLALEQQYAEAEQKFTEFQGVQQELVETIEQMKQLGRC